MALLFSAGLEEDFNVWKSGFAKKVFPVLKGEVVVQELVNRRSSAGGGTCACGKESSQCSGGHSETTGFTHMGEVRRKYIVSIYMGGFKSSNFQGESTFVSSLVDGSPAWSAITLMPSRSLTSVSTAHAGKVLHGFVASVLYLEYYHLLVNLAILFPVAKFAKLRCV